MSGGRRIRELDSISDALLHACEEYLRGWEQKSTSDRMDQLSDSIQQLFKQRKREGDAALQWPSEETVPSKQLEVGDDIYASQFLGWVSVLHKELKSRTVSRYGSG
jgi:hypothetical protein